MGYTKVFLKWVGGKNQIIDKITETLPTHINSFHDVFVGGGSVLFAVLQSRDINILGRVYAYDKNIHLINTYTQIQTNGTAVLSELKHHFDTYRSLKGSFVNRSPTNDTEGRTSKESYYYRCRHLFNNCNDSVQKAALFIFLNKTCFRGLYREGPNGFNVPFGHYKTTPHCMTLSELLDIQELIKDVTFIHSDFNDSIKNIQKNDFAYFDPPYAPENKSSFVGYTKDGFGIDMHNKLFELVKSLKHAQFTMSNSNVPLVTEAFSTYTIHVIPAKRRINSKNPSSVTEEVIVTNSE